MTSLFDDDATLSDFQLSIYTLRTKFEIHSLGETCIELRALTRSTNHSRILGRGLTRLISFTSFH